MHTGFRTQESVRVLSADLEHRALDACLLSLALIEQLHRESFAFRPSRVHAKQHLGPVLSFGTTGAGADLHLCVAEIVLASKQRLELERVDLAFQRLELCVEIRFHLGIGRFAKQLVELFCALDSRRQAVVRIDPVAESLYFLKDLLRRLLPVPEFRLGHARLVDGQRCALRLDVKDTSALQRDAPRHPRAYGLSLRSIPPCFFLELWLEDFLAGAEHFVQRLLKMRRRAREICSHLRNVLFIALLYLFAKELLERSLLQPFRMLRRIVCDHVRNERASETLRAKAGIPREEGIDRTPLTRRGRRGSRRR